MAGVLFGFIWTPLPQQNCKTKFTKEDHLPLPYIKIFSNFASPKRWLKIPKDGLGISKLQRSPLRAHCRPAWVSYSFFCIKISLSSYSGLYIVFVLGISEDPLDITLQLGGILISIFSLTKGVAEYQVTEGFDEESDILGKGAKKKGKKT